MEDKDIVDLYWKRDEKQFLKPLRNTVDIATQLLIIYSTTLRTQRKVLMIHT